MNQAGKADFSIFLEENANWFCCKNLGCGRMALESEEVSRQMSLGENIKNYRLQKQLTQPELAEKAGISKGYVYMLESGEMSNPSLDILHKIATALDSTIADLIGQPRTAAVELAPEIPDALGAFIKQRRRAGERLSEEDIRNLARIQFRGARPRTVEDWAYVYEFLRRTFSRDSG